MGESEYYFGNWNYPTSIRFGAGRVRELPESCLELNMTRPLLITDAGLGDSDIVHRSVSFCEAAGLPCGVFSDVQGNPVELNVTKGAHAFKQGRHDGVIAFGGGSGLDAAKAVALMVGQERSIWDFEDREDWWTRVNESGMAPVVAVPTTSGTGSEVGRASVITDQRDHTKKIIFHPKMLPKRVILDSELTIGLPAGVTAAVGMDALSHNLEAFCSPLFHPMAEGIALKGMQLIHRSLPRAYRDGSDLVARSEMLAASTMGTTAFQKGLGAMHALSHPCGAVLDTHHGLTNAVVMPYVLAFNRSGIEEKMTRLAAYLGLSNPSFQSVLDWVLELREAIGIPHTLADLGVREKHVAELTLKAVVDPSGSTNPLPLNETNLSDMYSAAIRGELAA
ncbi:MAG: NAD-dependent methanol dehydrogenase [Gammaproteobacteria bacterium]|nr:NAD-dependent methanol dehydrogenase [Gammaproteobacteria bacterium]